MKLGKSSIVAWCSFFVLSVLVLRVELGVDGIEGSSGLMICVGNNGSLVLQKLAASIADSAAPESLSLLLLIATTQRIIPFCKF